MYKKRQDIFDKLWDHFVVKKNPQSLKPHGSSCCYSGTGCAIGCLIDDKELCKKWDEMENSSVSYFAAGPYNKDDLPLVEKFKEYFNGLNTGMVDFLIRIQNAHDDYYHYNTVFPIKWEIYIEQQLRVVASRYGFEIPK